MTSATAVRARPILFSGPMVRALLAGQKTQTRRVIVPQPEFVNLSATGAAPYDIPAWCMYVDSPDPKKRATWSEGEEPFWTHCPYGERGDWLWVRETWANAWLGDDELHCYAADHSDEVVKVERWKPSIHMPRRLSRITLELTDVRIERLQDISEEDAKAEGVAEYARASLGLPDEWTPIEQYRFLWNSLNDSRGYGWDVNPWVWVLSFRRADGAA